MRATDSNLRVCKAPLSRAHRPDRVAIFDIRPCLILTGVLVLGLAACTETSSDRFETATVEIGDVVDIVPAVGTVRPAATVEVSAEISGRISEILVDFDGPVSQGDVLARIDAEPWQAALERERSALAVAIADLEAAEARRDGFQHQVARADALAQRGATSESRVVDLRFSLREAEAQASRARASVGAAETRIREAEINLRRTEIRSPIDGFVLDRRIEVGQAVNAVQSAPVLFVVAANLRDVVIEARVAEADVGRIAEGMDVRIRVDAYPNHEFIGQSGAVRRSPEMEGRFVSYPVNIATRDPEGVLLPGMTASVEFVNAEARHVMRIPTEALYAMMSDWTPEYTDEELIQISQRLDEVGAPPLSDNPRLRRAGLIGYRGADLYISGQQDIFVRRAGGRGYENRVVRLGAEDGDFVEVTEGDLQPGDEVILRDHLDYDWGVVN